MNGFNPYLADVYAAMSAAPPEQSLPGDVPPYAPPPDAGLVPAAPPIPPPLAPPAGAPEPPAMLTAAPPPMPPPPMPGNPFALPAGGLDAPIKAPVLPAMPPGPTPAPSAPASEAPAEAAPTAAPTPAGPAAPDVGATLPYGDVNAFPLASAGGGGVVPAHEVDVRGPSLAGQQAVMNDAAAQAVGANTANTHATAQHEYEAYLQQQRDAQMRQAAFEQAAAERAEELADRQADFDASVKQLSKMSLDPDRFWATRSTGQRIGAMLAIALGGFNQGIRGGSNAGMDMINAAIDRDIRAQEFAYHAAHDAAQAKQTAFSLAMQKYQNVDAARAMARASAMDAAQAQIAQNAALWKDTDAANRANIAYAELEANKAQQIAQGIRFLPATARGRVWVDPETGITYTEDQARNMMAKIRENRFAAATQVAGVGGHLTEEAFKASLEKEGNGLDKAGRNALALENAKAERERNANLKAINNALEDLPNITAGGPLGAAAARNLPSGLPGVTTATNQMNARESYNNRAMLAVAAAYKLSTDATEPKNLQILEHYSNPYVIKATDNDEVARAKMNALKKLVTESAAAKGDMAPASKPLPASFTAHGRK